MATTIRVQQYQNDTVALLAVQGRGTNKFMKSNMPQTLRGGFGAVFNGRVRVTKSTRSGGYFFLALDKKVGERDRRVFFAGDALVRIGENVMTVDRYYAMLEKVESMDAALARLRSALGV